MQVLAASFLDEAPKARGRPSGLVRGRGPDLGCRPRLPRSGLCLFWERAVSSCSKAAGTGSPDTVRDDKATVRTLLGLSLPRPPRPIHPPEDPLPEWAASPPVTGPTGLCGKP